MSHWMSHVAPPFTLGDYERFDWWGLPEAELLERIVSENQAFEDSYPCDNRCDSWLAELLAMSQRYENVIAPRRAPWAE